jgi:hypothetical protein
MRRQTERKRSHSDTFAGERVKYFGALQNDVSRKKRCRVGSLSNRVLGPFVACLRQVPFGELGTDTG